MQHFNEQMSRCPIRIFGQVGPTQVALPGLEPGDSPH